VGNRSFKVVETIVSTSLSVAVTRSVASIFLGSVLTLDWGDKGGKRTVYFCICSALGGVGGGDHCACFEGNLDENIMDHLEFGFGHDGKWRIESLGVWWGVVSVGVFGGDFDVGLRQNKYCLSSPPSGSTQSESST